MTAIPPISGAALAAPIQPSAPAMVPSGDGFGALLAQGLHSVQAKVDRADALVKAFALDDSIPVHQVTYALEEARIAVELAMQVRSRLLDGYRELMNMQL